MDLSKWGVVVYANAEMGGTNGVIQAVNTPATEFESAEVIIGTTPTTIKPNSNFIFPHGLSQKPKSVRTVLVCKTNDADYLAGEEVDVGSFTSSGHSNFVTSATPTEIKLYFIDGAGDIILPNKTTATTVISIDYTKWAVKVYANSELGGYKGDRGPAGTGKIAQVKYSENTTVSSYTTVIPHDSSIPQNTEGTEIATVAITPKNPDSKLIIEFDIHGTGNTSSLIGAIFVDNQVDAIKAKPLSVDGSGKFIIPANGTNTRTYKCRMGRGDAGTWYLNSDNGGNTLGVPVSTLVVTEILP
jgi:hypothetical protein